MSFPAQTTSKTTTNKTTDLKDQLAQPRQIVEEIVRLEMTKGARRSLERRLVRSRIGRFKPITDFD